MSIRHVINPAPGWGAGPGDPDGTGQTLHVSPCAVVALYGAGGIDCLALALALAIAVG